MKTSKPLMGLCPIGKFVFSNEDALRYKQLLQAKLGEWGVDFVDLEDVLEDGLVKDQQHVDIVVDKFERDAIDCLFVPHCNFGTEGAVGMIARKLNVPTLLWGPRDEAPLPDGQRLRDTLCGLFASSKVLHKLGVPFTYIENCSVDDGRLQQGVEVFLRAVSAADALRSGVRIGIIGQRIDFFWTTIINESELLERFNIELLPVDMAAFISAVTNRAEKGQSAYQEEVDELRQRYTVEGVESDLPLVKVLAARDEMLALAQTHALDGIAFQSFMSIIEEFGSYCSYTESTVSEHLPVAAETDVHGVISSLLLKGASFAQDPTYLAEFTVRHPEDDNAVLLWHEGAPLSMCHPDETPRLGEHWILPSPVSGMTHFKLRDGPITVARFDGDHGDYKLAVGEGVATEGPATLNNYVWMKVNDWPAWERILMEGPFIHHVAMAYGNYADALVEACKYIPGLEPVRLDK